MTDSVLCCNDIFLPEFIELYEKFGVVTPKEGKLYTFRKIIKTLNGTGVLLNELLNPDVPIIHPIGKTTGMAEPSFSIKRFVNLDQSEITEEEVREAIRQNKQEKVLVKPIKKENDDSRRIFRRV